MPKNLRWKLLTILAVVALSAFAFYPPDRKVRLALDLKGGVHLVPRVQTEDPLPLLTEGTADQVREAVRSAGVAAAKFAATGTSTVTVTGVPGEQDAVFRSSLSTVELSYDRWSSGPGNYTFEMKPDIVVDNRESTVNK